MKTAVSPDSVQEALGMLRSAMGYLAAADATQLATATQAECLLTLEQVNSIGVAVRTSFLGAFAAGQGYGDDGDYSATAWLIHKTGVTRGAAAGYTAWIRRAAAHPLIAQALAAGQISESYARVICSWTARLPEDCRPAAEEILLAAAGKGLDLAGLAGLAAEIYARARPQVPDQDDDQAFDDRAVKLETTFEGAGVLHGDLTPECAQMVRAVLDALSAPADADDPRTHEQRYHDALQEAMRRLAASGLLPQRAGQPVKVWVHISLAELLAMQGSTALVKAWVTQMRAAWAAHRAAASAGGGDLGAWLDGQAAAAVACDAAMAPYVTGDVNPAALEDLVRLCTQLGRLRHGAGHGHDTSDTGQDDGPPAGDGESSQPAPAPGPDPDAAPAREALEQAIIGAAVDLLSGPGGLASFLRRHQLGDRLGGPSVPLDIGYSDTVPAGIRNAVMLRGRHCEWSGGCNQPASACEVHHVRHKKDGGKTSTKDCVLLCFFHHQVMIHRRGWTLVLNPDGTTTAWNPDKTKVLHSHGPPARAG